jgi:hypothetical protein
MIARWYRRMPRPCGVRGVVVRCLVGPWGER